MGRPYAAMTSATSSNDAGLLAVVIEGVAREDDEVGLMGSGGGQHLAQHRHVGRVAVGEDAVGPQMQVRGVDDQDFTGRHRVRRARSVYFRNSALISSSRLGDGCTCSWVR